MTDLFLFEDEYENGTNKNLKTQKIRKIRAKFTPEEDLQLKYLVGRYEKEDWQSISEHMPGRNPRQCRDRYKNYLSPQIVNGPWSEEEDKLLMEKYEEFGPSWKRIATFFPSRTDINIKSRFHLKERRHKKEELKKKRLSISRKMAAKHLSMANKKNNRKSSNDDDFQVSNFSKPNENDNNTIAQKMLQSDQIDQKTKIDNQISAYQRLEENSGSEKSQLIDDLFYLPFGDEDEQDYYFPSNEKSNSSANDGFDILLMNIIDRFSNNFYNILF